MISLVGDEVRLAITSPLRTGMLELDRLAEASGRHRNASSHGATSCTPSRGSVGLGGEVACQVSLYRGRHVGDE